MPKASLDDRSLRIDVFVRENQTALARNGAVRRSWRTRDGRRTGPYYRLECRIPSGRKDSVYLGSDGPLAESVRERLAQLRQPGVAQRKRATLERKLRQMSQVFRSRLDDDLRKLGLRLHGAEIRGFRTGPFSSATPPPGENRKTDEKGDQQTPSPQNK